MDRLSTLFASIVIATLLATSFPTVAHAEITVSETDEQITIDTPQLQAVVRKKGYVTGVAAGSLLDKKTGARDAGYGLDIVDWIMEPGADDAYRDQLEGDLAYPYGNAYHGQRAKRSIEGPQICTKAHELKPEIVRGPGFAAVKLTYRYHLAAPGKKTGSLWTQWLVFPEGKRYFVSSDRIDAVNSSDAMFLRLDMPGHIKHDHGDSFSEIYLSYIDAPRGKHLPATEFLESFAPDERFNYRRDSNPAPERFIRGYRTRVGEDKQAGPWLLGLTLDPTIVHEAWCHQRGYVCMIQEFGGRPVQAGGSFSAAFIVGYFDSIDEANQIYDENKGSLGLSVDASGWRLTGSEPAEGKESGKLR